MRCTARYDIIENDRQTTHLRRLEQRDVDLQIQCCSIRRSTPQNGRWLGLAFWR